VTWTTGAAGAYVLFLFLWGFNYRREPLEHRLPFDAREVTTARVASLARDATVSLNTLYPQANARPWPAVERIPVILAPQLADIARQLSLGWSPRAGRPKRTLLAPYFRWAAIAAMTNPFGLEVLLSPDTLPFERHAVMAHEWGHLAGFANEAEAGFIAWLMCLDGDAQAQYSGWLNVWPSLVAALPPAARGDIVRQLGNGPRGDLRAIAVRNAQAVETVRNAAWRGYDAYLKSQHVADGIASYEGVVRLMAGYRRADP
jgi:hypothetical protein